MQIVSNGYNVHETSIIFSGKNMKKCFKMSSARMLLLYCTQLLPDCFINSLKSIKFRIVTNEGRNIN